MSECINQERRKVNLGGEMMTSTVCMLMVSTPETEELDDPIHGTLYHFARGKKGSGKNMTLTGGITTHKVTGDQRVPRRMERRMIQKTGGAMNLGPRRVEQLGQKDCWSFSKKTYNWEKNHRGRRGVRERKITHQG